MTGPEKSEIHQLRTDLFGEDGEGGAIGKINERLEPVHDFYQQAIGVLRVVKWLGAGTTILVIGKLIGL